MWDGIFKVMMSVILGINLNFILSPTTKPSLSKSQVRHVLYRLSSPEKVVQFFSKFKYKYHEPGMHYYIKDPGIFLYEKEGDCKDVSFLINQAGLLHRIDTKIICIWPGNNKDGHAICIWKIDGKFYPLCNVTMFGRTIPTSFNTMKELLEYYRKKFRWKKINDWWVAKVDQNRFVQDSHPTLKDLKRYLIDFKPEIKKIIGE